MSEEKRTVTLHQKIYYYNKPGKDNKSERESMKSMPASRNFKGRSSPTGTEDLNFTIHNTVDRSIAPRTTNTGKKNKIKSLNKKAKRDGKALAESSTPVSSNLIVSSSPEKSKGNINNTNNYHGDHDDNNYKQVNVKRSQSKSIKKALLKLIPRSKSRLPPTKEGIEHFCGFDINEETESEYQTTVAGTASASASTSTYDEHNIELELSHKNEFDFESITTTTSKLDAVVNEDRYKSLNLNLTTMTKRMGRCSPCFGSDSDSDSLPESAPQSAPPSAHHKAPELVSVSRTNTDTSNVNDKERHEFAQKCSVKRNSQLCVTNDESDKASKRKGAGGAGWYPLPGNYFSVRRGPNYTKNKKKAPSEASLYDSIHCLAFRSEKRTSLIDTLPLPSMSQYPGGTLPPLEDERIPHLIIIQYQIPSEQPSMVKSTDDGKGGQVAFYFVASEHFCKQSNALMKNNEDSEVSGAVKLFTEWCAHCEDSKSWRSRFKTIAKVRQENADSGSFLRRFNGKPMLVKESSSVRKGVTEEGIRYLEYSVNSKYDGNDSFDFRLKINLTSWPF